MELEKESSRCDKEIQNVAEECIQERKQEQVAQDRIDNAGGPVMQAKKCLIGEISKVWYISRTQAAHRLVACYYLPWRKLLFSPTITSVLYIDSILFVQEIKTTEAEIAERQAIISGSGKGVCRSRRDFEKSEKQKKVLQLELKGIDTQIGDLEETAQAVYVERQQLQNETQQQEAQLADLRKEVSI